MQAGWEPLKGMVLVGWAEPPRYVQVAMAWIWPLLSSKGQGKNYVRSPPAPLPGICQAPGMMLTHAGPQSPRGASPFACPGLCRQSYAHVAQALSGRGLSLASRADSCLEHGQHRLPAAYKTWDGHIPHCRGTFLPLASPCLAGVFHGWLFPFIDALAEVLLGCHRQHVINQLRR